MATKKHSNDKKLVRSTRGKKLVLDGARLLTVSGDVVKALGPGLITLVGTGKSAKKTSRSPTGTRQTVAAQMKSVPRRSKSPVKRRFRSTVRHTKDRIVLVAASAVEKTGGLKGLGLIEVGQAKKLELRDRLGMTRPIFGRIVNVAERTIAKVESGSETADKLTRPYNEVYRLWEALSELVETSAIGPWLQTPNDAFDGLKPIEVIERGEIDRLWDMVFELQTGMPR